jgi:uncharacterized membrane protein YagU involved in acid resistance
MRSLPARSIERSLALGALAGSLAAATVAAMAETLGEGLSPIARPNAMAFGAVILIGAALGAGFGALVRRHQFGIGENLFWGMSYGVFWWVLGRLTLLPLILTGAFTWDLSAAQMSVPELVALLVHGSLTGLLLALVEVRLVIARIPSWGTLARGTLVGLSGAWFLGKMLSAQKHLVPMGAMMPGIPEAGQQLAAWVVVFLIGAAAGLIYAALYPTATAGLGVSAVRGVAYGFMWWVLGALTLLPVISGQGVGWSLDHVRVEFPTLPAFILFGSLITLLFRSLEGIVRVLLAEDSYSPRTEGPAIQAIRALGQGAAAGVAGGAIFTAVMFQVGFLPQVASLVGSGSAWTGFGVNFVIGLLVGMSYGLLFRRQSFDLSSALGWGLAYGFLWWIFGPLTLMPVLLGSTPQWDAVAAAGAFPALVGHLGYGAALGVVFYLLEARDRPWWLSRSDSEAERIAQRQEQILSSAPAIWVLIVMIALLLPVLLGTSV